MKKTVYFILLVSVLLSALPLSAAELQPFDTPINSYSGGVGMYRLSSTELLYVPLDYKYVGNTFGIGSTLGLISPSEGAVITLDIPITFKVASLGPVRFNAGIDFTNWGYLEDYFGIHSAGPLFSFTIPVPYNGSAYEVGFSVPFGAITDWNSGSFMIDVVFHNSLQLMFNDRFGVTFNSRLTENIYRGWWPTRIFLYGGPCIRW